jgi:hypothetical protein
MLRFPERVPVGSIYSSTTGLLEEELLQLRHLGVVEGAQLQITGDGLMMLGDRRLSFAIEFDQPCIKIQLRRAEANQFLEELERSLLREATEEPDEADLVAKPSRFEGAGTCRAGDAGSSDHLLIGTSGSDPHIESFFGILFPGGRFSSTVGLRLTIA